MAREGTEDSAIVSWDRVLADIDCYILSYSGSGDEVQVGADSTSYLYSLYLAHQGLSLQQESNNRNRQVFVM